MNIADLYPKYFDEITRFARSLTHRSSSAEDVTQETFLRALRNSPLLIEMEEREARAWLYTTAKHIVIDQARREARRPQIEAEDRYEDDVTVIVVTSVMKELGDEDRQLINLRYFGGLDSTEIGRMMGLPPATVRTRLRAAVKRLRAEYEKGERD